MTRIHDVLSILADGQFHSGEVLAQKMGVSRAAIWKTLKKIEDFGIEVHRVTGKGYRLPFQLELLNSDSIIGFLDENVASHVAIPEVHMQLDSTNHYLMSRPDLGHGHICLAEMQTAGRGRRGRTWQSPFGGNIYLSMLWEFGDGMSRPGGLSLAAAIAVTRALEDAGIGNVGLKWPNDILVQGQKLAGILLEMNGELAGSCRVVVGIGLNVYLPHEQRTEIDQAVTDLYKLMGKMPPRNQLVAGLINHLYQVMRSYEVSGLAHLQEEWLQRDVYLNQPVLLGSADKKVAGFNRGINEQGELILQLRNGQIAHYSGGELSLRLDSVE